ncbi:MAG: hypothetical protein Q8O90_01145, partial [Elusimicrobiota bacterium]|nr:hypothetical protein [Elusimicrobiota bacterium]
VVWRQEDAFYACIGGGDPMRLQGPVTEPGEVLDRILGGTFVFLPVAPLMHAAGQWTSLSYLFSGGAAPRLAVRTLKGYFHILCNPFNPFNRIFLNSHYSKHWNLLLFPFLWAGLWVFFSDAKKRAALLLGLLFLNALPALHDQIREPRILFHAAPFFFVLCAAGIERALASGLFSSIYGFFPPRAGSGRETGVCSPRTAPPLP